MKYTLVALLFFSSLAFAAGTQLSQNDNRIDHPIDIEKGKDAQFKTRPDTSGTIGPEEFKSVDIPVTFEEADTNHDGRISFEEMQNALDQAQMKR